MRGVYLDVDVEVLKSLNPLRRNRCYMGFQDCKFVAPGLIIGSTPHHRIMEALKQYYEEEIVFLDKKGKFINTPVGVHTNRVLKKFGLEANGKTQYFNDFSIYSKEYFSPIDCRTLIRTDTDNSYTVHYYAGSWMNDKDLNWLHKQKAIRAKFGDNIVSNGFIFLMKKLIR